jgi:hypothetical protein
MAKALADAGHWDQAEQISRSIVNPAAQARALATMAKTLAEADPDRALSLATDAEQAARRIVNPAAQARALGEIVELLAQARQWDRAEQLAQDITNQTTQDEAYVAIAVGLMAASAVDEAATSDMLHARSYQLLAQVLAGAHWLRAIRPLSRVDPAAVVAAHKELVAVNA